MARAPYLSLARDKSRRPVRGTTAGDMVTGPCEAVGCGVTLHRGDEFVVYLGDRPMCRPCHVAGAVLTPAPSHRVRTPRAAPKTTLVRKRDKLLALRRARTAQLRKEAVML